MVQFIHNVNEIHDTIRRVGIKKLIGPGHASRWNLSPKYRVYVPEGYSVEISGKGKCIMALEHIKIIADAVGKPYNQISQWKG